MRVTIACPYEEGSQNKLHGRIFLSIQRMKRNLEKTALKSKEVTSIKIFSHSKECSHGLLFETKRVMIKDRNFSL